MKLDDPRPKLLQTSALILALVTLVPTIVMPILVEQSIYFTFAGVFNMCMFGSIYLLFVKSQPKHWHKYLLFFAGFVALIPLVLISGGVNSQFMPLLPLTPLMIGLLSNGKDARIAGGLVVISIVVMMLFQDQIIDWTNESVSADKTRSRGIWLILAALLSTVFVDNFTRINHKLRTALIEQAHQDELTGVNNRRNIMQILQDKIANFNQDTSLAILMIDIDHFKHLNDTYGHIFGDECLQKVSACIDATIRKKIDYLGRYGGEEFLVLLTDIEQHQVLTVAEKIQQNIEQLELQTEQQEPVKVTVTIGSHFVDLNNVESAKSLIQYADKALYQGKEAGRNRVVSS